MLYLQWVFGADGQDLVLEVAELTAPGASFTDPADKAGLVSTAHRAITATRAQQLPLQDTESSRSIHRGAWVLKPRFDLVTMNEDKDLIRDEPNF